eukprot:2907146-Alexandrium_andersonii.AAC.1
MAPASRGRQGTARHGISCVRVPLHRLEPLSLSRNDCAHHDYDGAGCTRHDCDGRFDGDSEGEGHGDGE